MSASHVHVSFNVRVLPVEFIYPEESKLSFTLGEDFHPLLLEF